MNITIKELKEILNRLPENALFYPSSGEGGSVLFIQSRNGNKSWSILKDGTVVRHS